MHVCHVVDHLDRGGAQTFLLDLVRNTADRDVTHTVCSLTTRLELERAFKGSGASVVSIGGSFAHDPRLLARFVRLVGSENADVLHSHLVYSQAVARVARSFARRPSLVSTYQNTAGEYYPNPAVRTAERRLRFVDDALVAVSRAVRDSFGGGQRWRLVPNGVDFDRLDRFVDRSRGVNTSPAAGVPDGPTVLTAAILSEQKNLTTLVRAMALVTERLPEAKLVVVGDGPRRTGLQELASELGVDDSVQFLGAMDRRDVFISMDRCDVFAVSSTYEGFCIAAVEAMGCGLPVVASDIPVLREVIAEGGRFVDPNDHRTYASELVDLLSDTESRREMAAKAKTRARTEFPIEKSVDSYLEVYRAVTNPD